MPYSNRFLSACFVLVTAASAANADDYRPSIAAESKDAELALQGFVLPEGVSGQLLAAEPALANPVAFHVTDDGRVYVCETFRQEIGVEDNRNHMNWLHNDLRLESVEERLAMFRKYLGTDVAKYATQHDRIRLLKDTNGDGRFDTDTVFAQGFNDILDGTGAGVIEHNGRVYYTCIPKLWMLEDADGDGVADRTEALHHGYGVRVAFRGHDMHGLTVGPAGRLYFSIGDRGYNVVTKEGTRLKRVNTGAVFRCDADGSHLEVFAYGLRNPQELAFDDEGNLWTGDNNSDSGDQARWVYVVQDGDTGWRMYFQYLADRGPWNRERMWYPYQADEETTEVQPAFIVPPVANLGDGPSGLTYYPGLGLSERYQNHFFMADFRGTAGRSGIRSFSVKPKGATFELTDSHEFIWSILGTDVDFAPDGSLYVTDWVNGWLGEGKGRLYRFVDDQNISAVSGANVPNLLSGGIADASFAQLQELLSHQDRRVRQKAQFELVRRPERDQLFALAALPGDEAYHRHIAWALWQIGLESEASGRRVAELCAEAVGTDGDLGVQYTRILTDLVRRYGRGVVPDEARRRSVRRQLREVMTRDDARLAGFATVALGKVGVADDVPAVFELLAQNNNADPVLRHQAVMALVSLGERDPDCLLPDDAQSLPSAVKLGLVVALRRLEREEFVQFLDDSDPAVAAEAARAVHAVGSNQALNRLAFPLVLAPSHPKGISDSVVVRRALEAAYRLGGSRHALAVARVAGDASRPDEIRKIAADMLTSWNQPHQLDTVNGQWRFLPHREVSGLKEAVQDDLPGMLAGPNAVKEKAIELISQLGIRDVIPELRLILGRKDEAERSRVAAFRALAALSENVDEILEEGQNDSSETIRVTALELLAQRNPEAAIPALTSTVESGGLRARQRALELLGEVGGDQAERFLSEKLKALTAGQLSPAIALDLLKAVVATGNANLVAGVQSYRDQQQAGSKRDAWSDCLEGGDIERGRTVFFGRAAASCRRCHKVNGEGADVGPDLSGVARKNDRTYLLESIVDPNAKIAKGFETTIIVDIDGRVHSGIIKEENDTVVKLMTPQGALVSVPQDEIEERAKGLSGMPADITKNLSRDDVRDLVEYLASLKSEVPADSAHGNSEE